MNYQDYIDLGFTRTDMNDTVEFRQTGYPGFTLSIDINDRLSICVSSPELDKPKLYIKKVGAETYHILPITPEMVKGMLWKGVVVTECGGIYAAC